MFWQNNFIKPKTMEKIKPLLRKITFVLIFLIGFFIVGDFIKFETNAHEGNIMDNAFSKIVTENIELKKGYVKLEERLELIEKQLDSLNTHNNTLYAEISGVNYDTVDFHKFRNDSANSVFTIYDTIFNNLDRRSLHAAEMLALQLEKLQQTSQWFQNNKNVINYYPTISPIKTIDFICVSSPYGWRSDPITGRNAFHEGLDISANPGTEVYATASGRVVKILYSKYGYGNRLLIRHNYGFETLYAHLGIITVKKGQWVNKGQKIGTVGNTGKSTGPHLHYEIHKNNQPRDPMGYFYTHLTGELLAMSK